MSCRSPRYQRLYVPVVISSEPLGSHFCSIFPSTTVSQQIPVPPVLCAGCCSPSFKACLLRLNWSLVPLPLYVFKNILCVGKYYFPDWFYMWTGTFSLLQRDSALNPCSCLESAKSTIFTSSMFRDWVNPTAWAYRNKSLLEPGGSVNFRTVSKVRKLVQVFLSVTLGRFSGMSKSICHGPHHKKSILSEITPREPPGFTEGKAPTSGVKKKKQQRHLTWDELK